MPKNNNRLEDFEVALIKNLLNRGMRNADIQFYFNRPNRRVNNGRISEIKGGVRGEGIAPASEHETDEFIETHPLTVSERKADDPWLPARNKIATVFTITNDDLIDIRPDPPTLNEEIDQSATAFYGELRRKVSDLQHLGHNNLGELSQSVDRFCNALPSEIGAASITLIWSCGNTLRAALRSHNNAVQSIDPHPDKLEHGCAAKLEDVVETFNIFIATDIKGRAIDQLRLGPKERAEYDEAMKLISPAAEAASHAATNAAELQIRTHINNAANARAGIDGDQAVALSSNSIQNLIISTIKDTFWKIRKTIGKDFSDLWKTSRRLGYTTLGAVVINKYPPFAKFLKTYAPEISQFLELTSQNPIVKIILDFITAIS
ncbi:hypothetical protein [Roseibium sp.]|uniref:hypothetical protein n=1 Tax=Roseibium sp. TaxID=1936156 RepID=UPI0032634271